MCQPDTKSSESNGFYVNVQAVTLNLINLSILKTKKHQQFLKLQAIHPNVTIIDGKVQELVNNYHNNIRKMTHGLAC